jgi:hypothetical protein
MLTGIYIKVILLMSNKIKLISESELRQSIGKLNEEQLLMNIKNAADKLTNEERENIKKVFGNNKTVISEAWYNTLGDVIGIFDPTGIVDVINGISYFSQGEKLFGTLSLISAVPYVGDVIAKPFLLGGKAAMTGAKSTKAMGMIQKTYSKWGPKVIEMLDNLAKSNIPVAKGVAKQMKEYIEFIGKSAKTQKVPMKQVMRRGKPLYRYTSAGLKPVEKVDFIKVVEQMLKPFSNLPRGFRNYAKKESAVLFGKNITKFWKSPPLRRMLGRTKLWLYFLDIMGIGNFIGPDEFMSKYGDKGMKQFGDFMQSEDGQRVWEEEFGDVASGEGDNTQGDTDAGSNERKQPSSGIVDDLFKSIFKGII